MVFRTRTSNGELVERYYEVVNDELIVMSTKRCFFTTCYLVTNTPTKDRVYMLTGALNERYLPSIDGYKYAIKISREEACKLLGIGIILV